MTRLLAIAALVSAAMAVPGPAGAVPTNAWPGGRWQPDAPKYGMTVVKNVAVTMSDGATLHADIGYPTDRATGRRASGTFPVLLTQNPYSPTPSPNAFFVSRGYIFVVAEVRGTGNSQAAPGAQPLYFDLFSPRQAQDGVELVNWVAHKLPGSNGVVGLTGCSFLGINQLFTAAAIGPHSPIAAILPACASNGYEIYFSGGIPTSIAGLFGSASVLTGTKNAAASVEHGKQLSDDIKAGGDSAYNRGYWQTRTTARVAPDIVHNGIPALLWSGWRATELGGVLDEYSIFQNTYEGRPSYGPMTTDQRVTGRYQMIIGSGEHASGLDPSIELEWFDRWIKHEQNGIDETATPMHLFEMQSNRWVNATNYPIVATDTPYYLQPGSLAAKIPGTAQHDTIRWGATSAKGTSVTYTSAPFAKGMTLAGPTTASIFAASNNTNMELVATLFDVAPGGKATVISHGALLGSMRATDPSKTWVDSQGNVAKAVHPFGHDVYLTPGTVQRFDIGLLPIVWAVQPGHSLRLLIASQASTADCQISLANGLPQSFPCLYTAPQRTLPGGTYQLMYGGRAASVLALPMVDPAALPTAASAVTATSQHITEPLDWGSAAAARSVSPSTTAASTTSSSSWWVWIVVGVGVLALALIAGIAFVTRRRKPAA